MDKDIDVISNSFKDSSARIVAAMYGSFEKSVYKLDRQKDQNVFNQTQGRHITELERQLNDSATQTLNHFSASNDAQQLRMALTSVINSYVTEFTQKIKSQ